MSNSGVWSVGRLALLWLLRLLWLRAAVHLTAEEWSPANGLLNIHWKKVRVLLTAYVYTHMQ